MSVELDGDKLVENTAATAAAAAATGSSVDPIAPIPEDIPDDAVNARVPLDALVDCLAHGQSLRGDSHRFSTTTDPDVAFSKVRKMQIHLSHIFFIFLLQHFSIYLSLCKMKVSRGKGLTFASFPFSSNNNMSDLQWFISCVTFFYFVSCVSASVVS